MGYSEDNIWSVLKDLMPLWMFLGLIVLTLYIYAKTPSPPPPKWMQNRYVRLLAALLFLYGFAHAIYQAGRAWRLF
jgi:disulfide bond formation protein DsbB